MAMVLLEPLLHRAVSARQAFTAHLPGISAVPRLTGHAANYVVGSFILLCWAAATAALGWPVWLWSIATVVVLGFYGATAMNAYRTGKGQPCC